MNNSKNWIQILKSEVLSHCEPAQGRLTSLFKTWIQFLELFINLIQNAYVFPNTILKHLYWSEFGFLVLLWSFFHLFTFLKSKQFQSEPAQGRPTCFLRNENSLRSEPAQGRLTLKSRKKFAVGKKKFFVEKYFFLRVLWTSKLFWWKVWILYYIWPANLSGKACIPISVAAFFSRFR